MKITNFLINPIIFYYRIFSDIGQKYFDIRVLDKRNKNFYSLIEYIY